MKLSYDFGKSLLLLNSRLTKDIFLEKSGAKNGYSITLFSKMFDSIFSGLIDLEMEFEKYYSFEYDSIEQFLYKKYNLKADHIIELIEQRKNNPDCGLYRKDDYSYGDYAVSQFVFSDTMYERIINILTLRDLKI